MHLQCRPVFTDRGSRTQTKSFPGLFYNIYGEKAGAEINSAAYVHLQNPIVIYVRMFQINPLGSHLYYRLVSSLIATADVDINKS